MKLSRIHIGFLSGFGILIFSLLVGTIGFKHYCQLDWYDAFLNASMILSGMGPIHEPNEDVGKVFAGIYALYSGIIFLSLVAIMAVPVFAKSLNRFSTDAPEDQPKGNE